jgi:DedD protein
VSDADNLEIKKRARRRLVGAAALALLAAIVLPMTMDQEPYPAGKDIQVTIPDRDAGTGKLRLPEGAGRSNTTEPIVPVPEELAPEDAPEADLAAPAVPVGPAPTPTPAAAPAPSAPPPAPAVVNLPESRPKPAPLPAAPVPAAVATPTAVAQDAAGAYTLQVGAFANGANADRIAAKLQQQGLPAYTEKVGNMTRVRVGPFAARAAADKAAAQLKAMGHGALPSPR